MVFLEVSTGGTVAVTVISFLVILLDFSRVIIICKTKA